MKQQEFNLSDFRYSLKYKIWVYPESNVKEFIKIILREADFLSNPDWRELEARINKLAGNKLV